RTNRLPVSWRDPVRRAAARPGAPSAHRGETPHRRFATWRRKPCDTLASSLRGRFRPAFAEQHERCARGHLVGVARRQRALSGAIGFGGVNLHAPARNTGRGRHGDAQRLEMRVEQDQRGRRTVDGEGDETRIRKIPIGLGHLLAVGTIPGDVLAARGIADLAFEKMVMRQVAAAPERDQPRDEIGQVLAGDTASRPIDPADLIVLAIGVVVAALAIADLIAGEDHRHALREKEGGKEVATLLLAQANYILVVGWAFGTAIPRDVIVRSVVVVFAVSFI